MEISINKPINKVLGSREENVLATEKANLLIEINRVKSELECAYNNFEHAQDNLLVDFYTYQIKAYEAKFEYLIKKAKQVGLGQP